MKCETFGTCCGAIMLHNFFCTTKESMCGTLKSYLEGEWDNRFGVYNSLPSMYMAITNTRQENIAQLLADLGFVPTNFWGIHPPKDCVDNNTHDLTFWMFVGDIQTVIGDVVWRGKPKC